MNCTVEDALKQMEKELGRKLSSKEKAAATSRLSEIKETKDKLKSKKSDPDMLFSGAKSIISEMTEFHNEFTGIQNDPKKIKKLFRTLGKYDKVKISEKHQKHLENVLDMFVDSTEEFIRETTIKINKKYEGQNNGSYSLKKDTIYLGIGLNEPTSANAMSMQEIFVHELIHAATEYAKTHNKADVVHAISMIEKMYDKAAKEIKPSKKLPKETLDYIFNRDPDMTKHHGTSEFIAYAITNEAFAEALDNLDAVEHMEEAKSITEWIHQQFMKLMDMVFGLDKGARGLSMNEAMVKFSMELARANNTMGKEIQRGVIVSMMDKLNDVEAKVAGMISDLTGKFDNDTYIELYGKYGRFGGTAASALKFLGDKESKDKLLTWLDKTGIRWLDKRGSLQTWIRDFRPVDDYNMFVQRLGYLSNKIEQYKRDRERTVVGLVKDGFKNDLSREEDTALGITIVDTDLASLREYSNADLKKYLSDNDEIDKEISNILDSMELDKGTRLEYGYRLQALGEYMATGKTNIIGAMLNTKNIAQVVEGGNLEHIPNLDKIASLIALKNTSMMARETTLKVLEKDTQGVRYLMEMADSMKKQSKEMLFKEEAGKAYSQYINGYVRDVTNPDRDVRIAPANQVDQMLKEGYRRVEILKPNKYGDTGVTMAVYVSNEAAKQALHRGAIIYSDRGRRGMTLTEMHTEAHGLSGYLSAEEDLHGYKKDLAKAVQQMREGTYQPSDNAMPIPVYDLDGNIIDVRYTMSKVNKTKYLQRDARASVMLGKTAASTLEKYQSMKWNKEIIDILIDDMEKYMTEDNADEYVKLSPDSTDPEIKEMMRVLPKYLRDYMDQQLGNDEWNKRDMYVRKDVYRQLFGYRSFSMDEVARHKEMYRAVRYAIRMAEKIWKSIVSIYKVSIVIKTPAVLLNNVLSNFIYSIWMGMPITEVYKKQMDAIEALNQYQKYRHELDKLEMSEGVKKTEAGQSRMKDLKRKMKDSPIHDMMEAGLYTPIEELEVGDLDDPNMLVRTIDRFMEDVPQVIRTGADYLFVTKRTPLFQYMTKATQYSDFIARYGLIDHYMKEAMKNGMDMKKAKDLAMNMAITEFINYDLPDSRLVQYANDIGLVMFTKYFQRIQRVIAKGVLTHPVQFIGALLGQTALWEMADITDSAMFIGKNPMDVFVSPLDVVKGVITPSGYEIVRDSIK